MSVTKTKSKSSEVTQASLNLEETESNVKPLPDLVMSVPAFVDYLLAHGLALEVEGELLKLKGPKEARTDRFCAYIHSHQDELITYLQKKRQDEQIARDPLRPLPVPEEQAATGEDNQDDLTDNPDANSPDDYGTVIGAAYRAAIEDRMPKGKVLLGKKRYTTDPSIMLQELVSDSLCLQKQYGAKWRENAPDGERIASDIETISSWYQRWYWSQGKTAEQSRSNCLLNEGGANTADDSIIHSLNSPSDDAEVF